MKVNQTVSRARLKAVIEAAKKRSFAERLCREYAVFAITECLKSDTLCHIDDDDPEYLSEMKNALNAFMQRQQKVQFAYEQFIEIELGESRDDARQYVGMVLDVLQAFDEVEDVEDCIDSEQ
jgi:hypothetical protein